MTAREPHVRTLEETRRFLDRQQWLATIGVILAVLALSVAYAAQRGRAERARGLAEMIDGAGRQRMLSQRIGLLASAYVTSTNNREREIVRQRLSETAAELETEYEELAAYMREYRSGLPRSVLDEFREDRIGLPQVLSSLTEAGRRLAAAPEGSISTSNRDYVFIRETSLGGDLVQEIDQLVAGLSEAAASRIQRLEHAFAAAYVLLALLIGGGVPLLIVPMIHRLRHGLEETAKTLSEDAAKLYELSLDLLCVASTDGHFVRVNPAFVTTLGYSEEELLSRPFSDFIHPEDIDATAERVDDLAKGRPVLRFVNRYRTAAGDWRWLSWRSRPDETTGLIYASARDVTRDREIKQELARRAELLERSNKELDEFAYIASHDLKAPLRDIHNLSDWIVEDVGDELPAPAKRHLERIQARIARMERLLSDLLDYSRVNRLDDDIRPTDLEALIDEEVELVGVPPQFELSVQIDVPPFRAKQTSLRQVVRNLISNAVKHHDKDRGAIEVLASQQESDVLIVVSDDGPGIPPEHHERIFEIFKTLRPRDEVEASGVGLAIVKKAVDAAGGSITVDSSVGRGTTFRVTWPITPPDLPQDVGSQPNE